MSEKCVIDSPSPYHLPPGEGVCGTPSLDGKGKGDDRLKSLTLPRYFRAYAAPTFPSCPGLIISHHFAGCRRHGVGNTVTLVAFPAMCTRGLPCYKGISAMPH